MTSRIPAAPRSRRSSRTDSVSPCRASEMASRSGGIASAIAPATTTPPITIANPVQVPPPGGPLVTPGRLSAPSLQQSSEGEQMAYEVPDLPYDYNALEPHIDEQTMRVHHDKHHQAYVDKANAALEGTEWADKPVNEVLQDLSSLGDKETAVRNNGGGHSNHSFFWEAMSPDGGGEPEGDLADAINDKFGDFSSFQDEFKTAGVNQFGSGWSWLVHDGSGLAVVSTANQDSPISDGQTPIIGVDVWEHAYYLKYQNKRPDYIDAWWNVVDWSKAEEHFAGVSG